MQEDFAEEISSLDARVAHADWVGLVDFWSKEAGDEREEDFAEDGGPFLVVCGGEFGGEEGILQAGEGLVADFAAGVEALGAEGFEDWGPVC